MNNHLEERIRELGVYEVEDHRFLPDIDSEGYVLRHRKSGARIALLPNSDSNKVFYIGFRTPPEDSTGVAHIIEHTVLCGSRDFPVKDPFIELAKGSLNTFLNAMTYPDKTVYPAASTNGKDFDNLMHVYLDAVFHPNIYKEQNIFRQEGWHYEVKDADPLAEGECAPGSGEERALSGDSGTPVITVNGVVYNEMKGVMSSPEDVLGDQVLASLFPDTAYAMVSGGDPAVIPELTYEQYLEFHRRFYHPGNSYIYLYGDMDVIERLRFLDEAYLSEYDRKAADSAIAPQKPFSERRRLTKAYSIQKDETPEGRTFLSWNAALPMHGNSRDILAFRVLDYVLCDAEGAPVKEALRAAGIGQDVSSLYDAGLYEPYYSITARYTDPEREEQFTKIIRSVLEGLVRDGLPRRALLAGINHYEFQYREADFGSYPRGLIYGLDILDTWLYDDASVWTNLEVGHFYEELRKDAEQGYFEELIVKYLLNNTHESVVVLLPEQGLTEWNDGVQREAMAKLAASLSPEELRRLRDDETSLRRWQETPDRVEDLRRIPVLSRSDLDRRTKEPVNLQLGEHVVGHPVFTGGIDYVEIDFDVSGFSREQFLLLALVKVLLTALDTQHYSYSELDNEINISTGGMSPGVGSHSDVRTPGKVRIRFGLGFRTMAENLPQALGLAKEIMLTTSFSDMDRIREVLEEEYAAMKADLPASGHSTALTRAASYLSEGGRIADDLSGISAYRFLGYVCSHYDEVKDRLVSDLQAVTDAVIACPAEIDITSGEKDMESALPMLEELAGLFGEEGRRRLARRAEEESAGAWVREFLSGSAQGPKKASSSSASGPESASESGSKSAASASEAPDRKYPNEGFTTAGQVQYVCRAGNYLNKGLPYHGALRVLKVILGYDYLWTRIRMKGGAYGCMSGFARDGLAYFVTYRDPHLRASIRTFEEAAEAVRSFEADELTMNKYVIGTISSMDRPMTPRMFGTFSKNCRLSGLDAQALQRSRDQVLDCTAEDIRSLADYIDAFLQDGALCVVGSAGKLEEARDLFGSLEAL